MTPEEQVSSMWAVRYTLHSACVFCVVRASEVQLEIARPRLPCGLTHGFSVPIMGWIKAQNSQICFEKQKKRGGGIKAKGTPRESASYLMLLSDLRL